MSETPDAVNIADQADETPVPNGEGVLSAAGVAGPARELDPTTEPPATDADVRPDGFDRDDLDLPIAPAPEDPNVAHGAE